MPEEHFDLSPVIARANRGDTGAALALLEHAADFLRARCEFPPELARYLADAFDRITGNVPTPDGWVPEDLTWPQLEALLADRGPMVPADEALHLKRGPGRPRQGKWMRSARKYFLAEELARQYRGEREAWRRHRSRQAAGRDFPNKATLRKYERRWRREYLGDSTLWARAKEGVARENEVSVRAVEGAWGEYGAGPKRRTLTERKLGEPEWTVRSFIDRGGYSKAIRTKLAEEMARRLKAAGLAVPHRKKTRG